MTGLSSEELHGRWIAPLAAGLARYGVAPGTLSVSAFLLGLAAAAAVASHVHFLGLGLFALGRILLGLSRAEPADPQPAAMNAVFDPVALAMMPFGFALADPARALAALFLVLGMLAALAARRLRAEQPAEFAAAAVTGLALALACAIPGWFSVIAYGLGLLGFVRCGIGLAPAPAETK